MEYRPCPICKGIRPEECECCKGKGRFPYPWVLPEDEPVRRRWTAEEDAVILEAPTPMAAYDYYCAEFGLCERSLSSVYCRWRYRQDHEPSPNDRGWTQAETDILDQALDASQAVFDYREIYGEARSEAAIRKKYERLMKE